MAKNCTLSQPHAFGYGSRSNLAWVLFPSQLDHGLTAAQLMQTLYVNEKLFYARSVPPRDGWGHDIDYAWSGDVLSAQVLGIRSFGRDGEPDSEAPQYQLGPFTATDYAKDIVWADGLFIRYPLGSKVQ